MTWLLPGPLHGWVLVAAGVSSLVLAAWALLQRPRERLHWSFAAGMLAFAAESAARYVLAVGTVEPEDRLLWLRIVEAAALVVPLPWAFFVVALAHPAGERLSSAMRGLLAGLVAVALAGVVGLVTTPAFQVPDIVAPFHAARLDRVALLGVIGQIPAMVVILAGLEACLRTPRRDSRWRIKYLVLGLGGVFLVRFYFVSQVLLFHVLMAAFLSTEAAVLCVGNLVIVASLARARLDDMEITVSRQVMYRSVVVVALGLYLLVIGSLGWVLERLGIPEELLWGSLLVFVAALAGAAVLLSEAVRWRIKRFIGMHFYREKYDYRQQWISFTTRIGSVLSVDRLAPEMLVGITEAAGAAKGVLYLADPRDGHYHLAGAVEADRAPATLDRAGALIAAVQAAAGPLVLDAGPPPGTGTVERDLLTHLGDGAVAVPVRWRGQFTGFMFVGAERTGAAYSLEDREFFATVAEQMAGAIVTARLSETVAQAREFEAFHRLTSFVIHDLKNSISALSLLSQNALAHFDDPEFQRDAIKTLSRTVERMRALLTRLSSRQEAVAARVESVDLSALALEATRPIDGGGRVSFTKDFGEVPLVPGDPDALLKVIQNLVTNAVEAISGAGTVTVRTCTESGWAVLSVTDTGRGMPKDFLQRDLFAPFRSTKSGGWGIGLYQARSIVEAHGGSIEVASEEGKGTAFRIKLPLAPRGSEVAL